MASRPAPFRKKAIRFFKNPPYWLGPLAGGLAGIVGGLPGILIGGIMGCLIQELFRQFFADRAVAAYFESPGRTAFYEGEPGLAAWCALAVIILAESAEPKSWGAEPGNAVGAEAACRAAAFSGGGKYGALMESFCRLAESRLHILNPDLLAESLAARRSSRGDLPRLGKILHSFAAGDKALQTAARIRAILDPGYRIFEQGIHDAAERFFSPSPDSGAWELLGLKPGASLEEVKSGFRRLAIQFHPDSLQGLDEKQREKAAQAFMKIEAAYREIIDFQ
ncbi:MAG: J domain-containing protein [Treponema sp.]|jgi:DnaJ-domain-containing protein 1|nr:J domain-containing protein [Treponema sp.]